MPRGTPMDNQLTPRTGRATGPRIVRGLALVIILLSLIGLADTHVGEATELSPSAREISQSFAVASRHWSVPLPVVMAVGYVESHWDQRGGAPSTDFGYGIMH